MLNTKIQMITTISSSFRAKCISALVVIVLFPGLPLLLLPQKELQL